MLLERPGVSVFIKRRWVVLFFVCVIDSLERKGFSLTLQENHMILQPSGSRWKLCVLLFNASSQTHYYFHPRCTFIAMRMSPERDGVLFSLQDIHYGKQRAEFLTSSSGSADIMIGVHTPAEHLQTYTAFSTKSRNLQICLWLAF